MHASKSQALYCLLLVILTWVVPPECFAQLPDVQEQDSKRYAFSLGIHVEQVAISIRHTLGNANFVGARGEEIIDQDTQLEPRIEELEKTPGAEASAAKFREAEAAVRQSCQLYAEFDKNRSDTGLLKRANEVNKRAHDLIEEATKSFEDALPGIRDALAALILDKLRNGKNGSNGNRAPPYNGGISNSDPYQNQNQNQNQQPYQQNPSPYQGNVNNNAENGLKLLSGGNNGINKQPSVTQVQIPPQFSIFVPGVQNLADIINFLSTYHPVETAYVGIGIAGGRLAMMKLPTAAVKVQPIQGGTVVSGNASVIKPTTPGTPQGFNDVMKAVDQNNATVYNGGPSGRLPQDLRVNPNPPRTLPTTRPIGLSANQNQVLQDDIAELQKMGASDIRVNQQQVAQAGARSGVNRPDLQFTYKGQRYYIEYDTPQSLRGPVHGGRILSNDGTGVVILKTVP